MISSPYRPELVTAAAVPLLTSPETKAWLRIDADDTSEDDLVGALIEAVTAHLDGHAGILGRCLISQTWRVRFDCWHRCMRLPFPDVSNVVVKVTTEAGATSTVSDASYDVLEDAIGAYVRFHDDYAQPSADLADVQAWAIEFNAGYGPAASDVPQAIRRAALLLVGHWYMNREAVNVGNITSELPLGPRALLAPYRRIGV